MVELVHTKIIHAVPRYLYLYIQNSCLGTSI